MMGKTETEKTRDMVETALMCAISTLNLVADNKRVGLGVRKRAVVTVENAEDALRRIQAKYHIT